MEIMITVNTQATEVQKGETILSALDRLGIHVPTLCRVEGLSPSGACRLCVVEVEGHENLVPACSYPIEGPISIRTHSPRVLRARKANVELLLANHPDDCLYCERNGSCELQRLAEELNIRERRIPGQSHSQAVDRSSPAVVHDPSKCILCGRCIRICEEIMSTCTLDFAFRGNQLRISTTMGKPLRFSNCTSCGQCIANCPTGAFTEKPVLDELQTHLSDPGTQVMVQYTAEAMGSVAESLGLKPGKELGELFNGLLVQCGFNQVFETSLGTELLIMEEIALLEERDGRSGFPLITSSCPAWVEFLKQNHPEYLTRLTPRKSPHQLLGRLIREQWGQTVSPSQTRMVSVLITSCIAAKSEASQEELSESGTRTIDLVLTPRELIKWIRLIGLKTDRLEPRSSNVPFTPDQGAGIMAGMAGGQTEALIRNYHYRFTGKQLNNNRLRRFRINRPYREMELEIEGRSIHVGSVSGLSNAVEVLHQLESGKLSLDYLEVMACPSGCVNGGGHPYPVTEQTTRNRIRFLQEVLMHNGFTPFQKNGGVKKFVSTSRGLAAK